MKIPYYKNKMSFIHAPHCHEQDLLKQKYIKIPLCSYCHLLVTNR